MVAFCLAENCKLANPAFFGWRKLSSLKRSNLTVQANQKPFLVTKANSVVTGFKRFRKNSHNNFSLIGFVECHFPCEAFVFHRSVFFHNCWGMLTGASSAFNLRNGTKEQLAWAPVFYQAGKLDLIPKSHLRIKNKAPLSPVFFSFVAAPR